MNIITRDIIILMLVSFIIGFVIAGVVLPSALGIWNLDIMKEYRNQIAIGILLFVIILSIVVLFVKPYKIGRG